MSLAARLFTHKKLNFVVGLAAVLGIAFGGGAVGAVSSTGDCDNNAIIHCGTGSASHFISTVKANNSGNGHHDLKTVYAAYGLESADYDKFVKYERPGTAYKDGRIVVDGQVVGTNATSIGRLASYQGSGYFKKTINGHTYYGNTNQKAFASNSIPVMVLFNGKGVMQFAVLTSCGNPTSVKKVTPSYNCNLLHQTHVSGNTYKFTTSASASHNAHVAYAVYDFDDGTTKKVTNLGQAVTHTFSKPGTYHVRVTVHVNLPGNNTDTVTSANCEKTITIAPPPKKPAPFFDCVQLTGAFIDKSKMSIRFTATAKFGNGATFSHANFDFGDHHSTNNVKPNGKTATATHTYGKPGNFTTTATLFFNTGNGVKSLKCFTAVTPTQPGVPECKPGIKEGSPMCQPCKYNSSLPSNSPKCVLPAKTLVNTGAGNVIAVFGAVVVAGFFLFRQFIFRRTVAATDEALAINLGHTVLNGKQQPDSEEIPNELLESEAQIEALKHPTYHRPRRFRPGKK